MAPVPLKVCFQRHAEGAGYSCTLVVTLLDEARKNGALESDLPFVLASSVTHLCCAWST